MQIRGTRGKSGLGVVSAYLLSKEVGEAAIRFYVDTGASHTTIAYRDALRIGIDYKKLKKAPFKVSGVGGVVDAYLLPNCMLLFQFERSAYIEYLSGIIVLKYDPRNKEELKRALTVPSLLGIDFLRHYNVRFTDTKVILNNNKIV